MNHQELFGKKKVDIMFGTKLVQMGPETTGNWRWSPTHPFLTLVAVQALEVTVTLEV